jgi:hypothetical protein
VTRGLGKNLKKEIGAVRYSASNSSKCVFKLESELKFLFCFCFVVFLSFVLVFMESLVFSVFVLWFDVRLPLRPGCEVHIV